MGGNAVIREGLEFQVAAGWFAIAEAVTNPVTNESDINFTLGENTTSLSEILERFLLPDATIQDLIDVSGERLAAE